MKLKGTAKKNIRYNRIIALVLLISLFALTATGCDAKLPWAADDEENMNTNAPIDDEYAQYLQEALNSMDKDGSQADSQGVFAGDEDGAASGIVGGDGSIPDKTDDGSDTGRIIFVDQEDSDDLPDSVFVSSSDDLFKNDTADAVDTPVPEEDKTTPEDFEVGTSQVYIRGELNSGYSDGLIGTINKIRIDMGYPPFTINTGLTKCANMRSREITTFLSHYRLDGSLWYSLAPKYYKAELLAIDNVPELETVEAWITDPNSRNLIFTRDYTSIGASCFDCNTLHCCVIALGY